MHNTDYSNAKPPGIRGEIGIQRLNLGNHFITVRRWPGTGPEIILIHGIGSSGTSWETVIPGLGKWFSPITLDLRGHGSSGKPESGYLYDDYIGDLEGVLAHLDLPHPLIMGHSLGGIVMLWWAARNPDRAAGLVVVDSPLRSGHDFAPAFDNWLKQNAMPKEELAAWYQSERPDLSAEQAQRRAEVMTSTARNVFAELRADSLAHDGVDRIAEIEHITSPILLVHGDPETGSMVHPEDAHALETRLADVQRVRLREAGHGLHRDRTGEFLSVAIPFLQECVARLSPKESDHTPETPLH